MSCAGGVNTIKLCRVPSLRPDLPNHRPVEYLLSRRILTLLLLGMASACQPTSEDADPPTLAILMAVDQLRADLLKNYDPLFEGGFRRLLDEGYRFENATHDHAVTTTAPGHTTLATGVHPTRHGVVGNSWFELEEGRWRNVYSLQDLDTEILGYPELPGRAPTNIYRAGLPDWIVANDPASRVVSISRKDRAAIGLAAKAAGDVYWLADEGGEFVTSDYYRAEYPAWITEFNATTMPLVYSDSVWESIIPTTALSLTRPDRSRFELDGEHTVFPHRASETVDASDPRALNHWRYEFTPFPDRAVFALATEAIRELQLGQRGSVDYLGISLSQTDLIGHNFGPRSREQLDNLLRLDVELGRFLSFLDEAVGPGRWVLGLSADHGVLDIPEHLAEQGVDASRLTRSDRRQLSRSIQDVLDNVDDEDEPAEAVREAVLSLPFVAAAYTFDDVEQGQAIDSFQVLYGRSHSRTRIVGLAARSGVYARFGPNVLESSFLRTSHGSPYYYDRHVPMIFLGGTISAGVSSDRVATVDMAPTLAWLTDTPAPDDLDGTILERSLRR